MKKMQFSLKELILSMTMLAVGLGIVASFVWINNSNSRIIRPGPLEIYVLFFNFLLVLCSGPLIGAAVGVLFKKPVKGAVIGLMVEVLGLIVVIVLLPYWFKGFGMGMGRG
jgi:hypothetical protein